jgi:hypothetical protein
MRNNIRSETARALKEALDALNPFIQHHTTLVCPLCEEVCCINKHGDHDDGDMMFISALESEMPVSKPGRNDTDPCRFLHENGCCLERWMRPFRCTWFFCDPLLESMKDSGKAYREFVDSFNRLILIRQKLIEES